MQDKDNRTDSQKIEETTDSQKIEEILPTEWQITEAKIKFDVCDDHVHVTSRLYLEKETIGIPTLFLNGENFELISVNISGKELDKERYEVTNDGLLFKKIFAKKFILKLEHKVFPSKKEQKGFFYTQGTFCFQSGKNYFRKITYFIDNPNILTVFRCKLQADKKKYPILLSNGEKLSSGRLDDKHWIIWEDEIKKPCNHFSLVLGSFSKLTQTYQLKKGVDISLQVYGTKEVLKKCSYALECLKKAIAWLEEKYGLCYRKQRYTLVVLENFVAYATAGHGVNIFDVSAIITSSDTATDEELYKILGNIANTYFRNWIGNRVSIQDWSQFILSEGLVKFLEQEFLIENIGIGEQCILSSIDALEDEPFHFLANEYKSKNSHKLATPYRGAEIFRMLQSYVGKKEFTTTIKRFLSKFDGCAVNISDFFDVMQSTTEKKLEQFMCWFTQRNVPLLRITDAYDDVEEQYDLFIEQKFKNGNEYTPLIIPLEVWLIDKIEGKIFDGEKGIKKFNIAKQYQKFSFFEISSPPLPALKYIHIPFIEVDYDYSINDFAFNIAYDTNIFNRWYLTRRIFYRYFQEQLGRYRSEKVLYLQDDFLNIFQKTITSSVMDTSYTVRSIQFPQESTIARILDDFDVDAISHVREHIVSSFASYLQDNFINIYRKYQENDDSNATGLIQEDVTNKPLQNTAVQYLGSLQDKESMDIVVEHYKKSKNINDKLVALNCIKNYQFRDEILEKLYEKWYRNPILYGYYLKLYASSSLPDTLQKIEQLTQDSKFDSTNFNHVSALIGTFCFNNPTLFHKFNGKGYKFVVDWIIKTDDINPQIAVFLARSFRNWHKHHPRRQNLIKEHLHRIYHKKQLSTSLFKAVDTLIKVNPM